MSIRHRAPRISRLGSGLALAALVLLGLAPSAQATSPNFPSYDSLYHNFPEMVSAIKAVEAAHPSIVHAFSFGSSYQGRTIWAAKISDNVGTDEDEPEVLFDALHHAREHLTVEQALYLLRLLANNYGTDASITNLVNSREIWIVFALNPDGFEYDLTGNPFRAWRKNRQPNPGSNYVGTDLNRNYDYRWACCGGSSSNPSSITYHGARAFSAPETQAMRDFVNSRVINGRQQIRVHVTFHTNGELILWPYGHTKVDVPSDMTRDDHNAFVRLGRAMAARNGYTPEQSSDLYITDGDQIDWMYGRHRVFSFTWELFPTETPTVWGDHYPDDSNIARQTARNRSALLYIISAASCPYGATLAVTHCGALFDDMEIRRGWATDPNGTDTATAGKWQWGHPGLSTYNGTKQAGAASSGARGWFTGLAAGTSPNANDLDGTTTLRSTPVRIPSSVGALTFRYYFAHAQNSSTADSFRAYVQTEDGVRHQVFARAGSTSDVDAAWATARVAMTAYRGHSVRLVFVATDGGSGSLVEAGLDDVRIERP